MERLVGKERRSSLSETENEREFAKLPKKILRPFLKTLSHLQNFKVIIVLRLAKPFLRL